MQADESTYPKEVNHSGHRQQVKPAGLGAGTGRRGGAWDACGTALRRVGAQRQKKRKTATGRCLKWLR